MSKELCEPSCGGHPEPAVGRLEQLKHPRRRQTVLVSLPIAELGVNHRCLALRPRAQSKEAPQMSSRPETAAAVLKEIPDICRAAGRRAWCTVPCCRRASGDTDRSETQSTTSPAHLRADRQSHAVPGIRSASDVHGLVTSGGRPRAPVEKGPAVFLPRPCHRVPRAEPSPPWRAQSASPGMTTANIGRSVALARVLGHVAIRPAFRIETNEPAVCGEPVIASARFEKIVHTRMRKAMLGAEVPERVSIEL